MKTSQLSCLLVLLSVVGAQSQQAPVAISGVVIESTTGRPLARVSLELRPYQPPPPPGVPQATQLPPSAPVAEARYPGITNDNGQFVFRNVPPGRYTLTASRNGYVHSDYGQRGPNGRAVPLTVAAGQPVTGIQLFITRAAAISGHVYDSKGAPFPYVQMNARRVTYTGGRRTLTITGSTYTDDQGEYRIYGLPPGQYVLSAEGETSSQRIVPVADSLAPPLPGSVVIQGIGGSMLYNPDPANQRKPQQRGQGAGAIYFRNATNDREAWPIDLRAGDDLKGTDITYVGLPTVPTTFSGFGGISPVTLFVLPTNMTINSTVQNGADFTFPLTLGSYTVVARAVDSARQPLTAYAAFDVSAGNPQNIKFALKPPVPLSGRIVLEGQPEGTPVPDLARAIVRLRRMPLTLGVPDVTVPLSATGTFASQVTMDGDYGVEVLNLPAGLRDRYLKSPISIRSAGQPVSDLEIVLGARGGQLEGASLSNATVVLVPEQRNRTDLYKSVTGDASGRFRFEGLTPGKYLLFSWEDVESDIWYNPEFIRAIEDRGKPVTIVEGSRETLDAAVIPMR